MKLTVQATFEIDITDWHLDSDETKADYYRNLKDDFYDYSVFMQHFNYDNFITAEVTIKK